MISSSDGAISLNACATAGNRDGSQRCSAKLQTIRLKRRPRKPLPSHPYRDSAILYGVMAAIVVVVSLASGGGALRGLVIAILFFVIATAWTWMGFRRRLRRGGG